MQQYTGGTTGLPKGAMLSHANIAANMSQIDKWGCGLFYPPSKVVAVLPFFHIFAMTVCMNVPLCNGTQVVMLPRFELKALLDLLIRTKPNVLPAVPTLLAAVAQRIPTPTEQHRLHRSRHLRRRGAARRGPRPLSPRVQGPPRRRLRPDRSLAGRLLRRPARAQQADVDRPAAARHRHPLHRHRDRAAVPRSANAANCRSRARRSCSATSTTRRPRQDAFMDGWLRTGDVGYVDEDGYVFLVDRIKDLIICSGFNVYPRTIEEALLSHPAVEETNVIGVPDEYRGEAPVAFVKLKATARPSPKPSSRSSSASSSTSSKCRARSSSRTSCPRP